MTAPVNTNILQQIAGGNATNATGASGGQGLLGKNSSAENTDFISLILSKLQGEGITPTSLQSLNTDANATGESLSIEDLSEKLTAILADLSASEGQNAPALQGNGQSAGQASSLLNNPLLAQQLGLDPQTADGPEIIATIQNLLGEVGIHTGQPIGQNTTADNYGAATRDTRTEHSTLNVWGEQSPSLNPNSGTFSAKDNIPAHLTTPTSSQKLGQDASPSLQSNATTSPLNTHTNPAASQTTGLDSVVSVTTGEAPSIQAAQAGLEQAQAELEISQKEILQGFTSGETAVPQSFVAAGAVEKPINNPNAKPTTGVPSQAKTPVNGAPSSASQQGATSPQPVQNGQAGAQMTGTLLTSPNTPIGIASGVDSTPDFTLGQDFSNSLSFDGQKLDGEITQNLKFDGVNTASQRASTSTPAHARLGASQAPNVRATIINMTRGADKGIDRLSLQLDPMELGRVEVELKMGKDGVLKASILADKPEALQVLQKDSNALQKALQEAGLDVGSDSFTFDLRDQNNSQFAQDKDSREMLFNINGLDDIGENLSNVNDNMHYGQYGQNYARADGVNIFV